MRKIVGKVGSNILAFTSHFADLTLALCPLGWGLTRRVFLFFFLLANIVFTIVSIKPYAICGLIFKRHGQNWYCELVNLHIYAFPRSHSKAWKRRQFRSRSLSFHKSAVFCRIFSTFAQPRLIFRRRRGDVYSSVHCRSWL